MDDEQETYRLWRIRKTIMQVSDKQLITSLYIFVFVFFLLFVFAPDQSEFISWKGQGSLSLLHLEQ